MLWFSHCSNATKTKKRQPRTAQIPLWTALLSGITTCLLTPWATNTRAARHPSPFNAEVIETPSGHGSHPSFGQSIPGDGGSKTEIDLRKWRLSNQTMWIGGICAESMMCTWFGSGTCHVSPQNCKNDKSQALCSCSRIKRKADVFNLKAFPSLRNPCFLTMMPTCVCAIFACILI